MISIFKKHFNQIITAILSVIGLITWLGHDFYNVTGIKQPDFPMNILIWLLPLLNVVYYIILGYVAYVALSSKQRQDELEALTKQRQDELEALTKQRQADQEAKIKALNIYAAHAMIFGAKNFDRFQSHAKTEHTNVLIHRNNKGHKIGETLILPEHETSIVQQLTNVYDQHGFINTEAIAKILRQFEP